MLRPGRASLRRAPRGVRPRRPPEETLPNDGWSGSRLTAIARGRDRFILKRTSPSTDWIARATRDIALREAVVAGAPMRLAEPLVAPYLGTGSDGDGASRSSCPTCRASCSPGSSRSIDDDTLELVLDAIARLHAMPWAQYSATTPDWDWPWCPLRERLSLLSRPSAESYRAEGLAVGERFLAGWDAFDRQAPSGAREMIDRLSADPTPLLDALARLPKTGLHGDLKLATSRRSTTAGSRSSTGR